MVCVMLPAEVASAHPMIPLASEMKRKRKHGLVALSGGVESSRVSAGALHVEWNIRRL